MSAVSLALANKLSISQAMGWIPWEVYRWNNFPLGRGAFARLVSISGHGLENDSALFQYCSATLYHSGLPSLMVHGPDIIVLVPRHSPGPGISCSRTRVCGPPASGVSNGTCRQPRAISSLYYFQLLYR